MTTKYIYVMGSESGAGKSRLCMGILAQLSASVLTKRSDDELMADVLASIINIGNSKKVVIIDGVSDP